MIANEVEDSLDAGNLKALLDPLAGDWPIVLAQELARLGLRCCAWKRKSRPNLGSDVWKALEPMNASCAASSSPQLGPRLRMKDGDEAENEIESFVDFQRDWLDSEI